MLEEDRETLSLLLSEGGSSGTPQDLESAMEAANDMLCDAASLAAQLEGDGYTYKVIARIESAIFSRNCPEGETISKEDVWETLGKHVGLVTFTTAQNESFVYPESGVVRFSTFDERFTATGMFLARACVYSAASIRVIGFDCPVATRYLTAVAALRPLQAALDKDS
jgi:hypothetical protein